MQHRGGVIEPVIGRRVDHHRAQEGQAGDEERALDQDRAYRQASHPGEAEGGEEEGREEGFNIDIL